ncbi:DUF4870 domain-containing protein [Frondihabitans australicus]|uniref:Tic20 family protein n=1 Tax=Frondihabitans australicus TaxID=386892 RepID=A0A495IAP0_9MICO|nr:DUF4870 domain-containing protein [Frondihabitans australicus]RKR73083.1 hypothetical protein C8E83_0168 [Frondihabitans australicus]
MSTPQPNPYAQPSTQPPLQPGEERQYSLLTHLLSIFFGFIPAVIFFVLYRDRGPFVRNHVVTEWNFQLTALIVQVLFGVVAVIGWATVFASGLSGASDHRVPPGIGLFFLGYVLIFATQIVRVIFGSVATVAANRGRFYRYPLAVRFVKE